MQQGPYKSCLTTWPLPSIPNVLRVLKHCSGRVHRKRITENISTQVTFNIKIVHEKVCEIIVEDKCH